MPEHGILSTVIATVGLLLVAALAAIGLKRLRLPYTVGLVIVGLVLGGLSNVFPALTILRDIELSPEVIIFVFLPTLIFESAFNLNSRLLSQNLPPVLTLAAPGLLLSTTLVGFLVSWTTPLSLGPALLFGALISATDPIAVVALFKELGAPKRLAILVEGESLFNDATAIVLFQIVLAVLAGGMLTVATVGEGIAEFAFVFGGGLAVGGTVGYLMVRSIALADDDPLVEVALSTVVAYAAFLTADHYLHVSGVMATVGAGLVVGTMGSTRFTPEVRAYLHQFWEYAAFVANGFIFLLVGLSVRLEGIVNHLGPIAWAILAVMVARAVTVFGLTSRLPGAERIDVRHQTVLWWGGLRGAVALALALSLPTTFAGRDLIIAMAVGVVLFTLLSGGLTMGRLIRWLGLDKPTLVERVARAQAAVAAKREGLSRILQAATAGHFSSRLIEDVERTAQAELAAAEDRLANLRSECQVEEVQSVLWSEAFTAERRAYRDLFERGGISEPVLRELELAVELERDILKRGHYPTELPSAMPIEVRVVDHLARWAERVLPSAGPVQHHRLRALAARYEHDFAVVEASQRVAAEVQHLADLLGVEPALADRCRSTYERRAETAMRRLDSIAEHFPEYVAAVQQQTARRMALDGEADAVDALAAAGGIPDSIASEARRAITLMQRDLMHQPVSALRPRPAELLARVPLFSDLAPDDFERVVNSLVPRTILKGDTVIQQDERGTSLFLLARGVVAVLVARDGRPPERIASLHAGDFFGEMALLTDQPRSATVQAVTDCQLYQLSKTDVDGLCEVCPGIKDALLKAYRERRAGPRASGGVSID